MPTTKPNGTGRFAYQSAELLRSMENAPTFEELQSHLPPRTHHDYANKRSWLTHILTNNMAVFPDFATQMGRAVHVIDVRIESELAKTGIIPGSNWYPRDSEGYLEKIQADFPSDTLLAVVDYNGVFSRHISSLLRSQYGFKFAAVLAGGVRLFKTFGFSVNRATSDAKRHKCEPVSLRSLEEFQEFTNDEHIDVRDKLPYHSERRTLEQVAKHVEGDLLQWIKMGAFTVHGRVSCIDGRGGNGCIGTPGGDMGEMVLILSTYEHLIGCDLTLSQINYLFQHRLDTFGRFYLHTDETNATRALEYIKKFIVKDEAIIAEIEEELTLNQILPENWLREFIHLTPESTHQAILDYLITPDCIGCGHLKLMLTKGEQYKVRPTLIKHLLRTFYEFSFWDETSDCDYVVLAGSHAECGVLSIEMQNEIKPYTKIPLIAPSIPIRNGVKQMFVSHPTIMTFLRKQQCDWLLEAIEAANGNALREFQNIAVNNEKNNTEKNNEKNILTDSSKKSPHEIISFVTLSKNARKAFNPLVDLSADQHAAISLGYLASALPIYRLVFDAEHSRCKVDFIGFVEALASVPAITTGTTPLHTDNAVGTAGTGQNDDDKGLLGSIDENTATAATTNTTTNEDIINKIDVERPITVTTSSLSQIDGASGPVTTTNNDNNNKSEQIIIVSSSTQLDIDHNNQSDGVVTNNMVHPQSSPQLSAKLLIDTIPSMLETPHQFAKVTNTDDGGYCADHHGMVVRTPYPQLTSLQNNQNNAAAVAAVQFVGLSSPLTHHKRGSIDGVGDYPTFTVTADLHLPSEVHHYPSDDETSEEVNDADGDNNTNTARVEAVENGNE